MGPDKRRATCSSCKGQSWQDSGNLFQFPPSYSENFIFFHNFSNFRNVYSSLSILIFTLSMAGWATYHLVNVHVGVGDWTTTAGEQTVAEEEREKKIELEDSDTGVKLPFRYLAHFIQVFGTLFTSI